MSDIPTSLPLKFDPIATPVPVTIRRPRSKDAEVSGMFMGAVYEGHRLRYFRVDAGSTTRLCPTLGWFTGDSFDAVLASGYSSQALQRIPPANPDEETLRLLVELNAELDARDGSGDAA